MILENNINNEEKIYLKLLSVFLYTFYSCYFRFFIGIHIYNCLFNTYNNPVYRAQQKTSGRFSALSHSAYTIVESCIRWMERISFSCYLVVRNRNYRFSHCHSPHKSTHSLGECLRECLKSQILAKVLIINRIIAA